MSSCGPVTALARNIWDNYLQSAGEKIKTKETVLAFWRQHQGPDGNCLVLQALASGNVFKGRVNELHSHLYLAAKPLNSDSINFGLNRLSGGARATVVICKINRNAQADTLWTLDLVGGDRRPQRINKRLYGLKGQLLSIYIKAQGNARDFHYELFLSKP